MVAFPFFWYIHAPLSRSAQAATRPNLGFAIGLHYNAFTAATTRALGFFVLRAWSLASPTVTMGVICHLFIVSADFTDNVIEGVVDVDA